MLSICTFIEPGSLDSHFEAAYQHTPNDSFEPVKLAVEVTNDEDVELGNQLRKLRVDGEVFKDCYSSTLSRVDCSGNMIDVFFLLSMFGSPPIFGSAVSFSSSSLCMIYPEITDSVWECMRRRWLPSDV